MKVTINDREYELKELTKEEAKAYIQKEVYVWERNKDEPRKRKLLEVFMTDCDYPFCVLHTNGKGVNTFTHCAPVPEEWYVYEASDGHFFFHCDAYPDYKEVDHGSHDYCVQKARELNDEKMPCSECKHTDEPMIFCSGCDNKSKFERKESAEHPLTNYELGQLLKSLGVECRCDCSTFTDTAWCYTNEQEKEIPYLEGLQIRYKCGEWMPATRETVFKWWSMESGNSDISRFVSFMGWFEKDKE